MIDTIIMARLFSPHTRHIAQGRIAIRQGKSLLDGDN
jgi:hypothetical protein